MEPLVPCLSDQHAAPQGTTVVALASSKSSVSFPQDSGQAKAQLLAEIAPKTRQVISDLPGSRISSCLSEKHAAQDGIPGTESSVCLPCESEPSKSQFDPEVAPKTKQIISDLPGSHLASDHSGGHAAYDGNPAGASPMVPPYDSEHGESDSAAEVPPKTRQVISDSSPLPKQKILPTKKFKKFRNSFSG